MTQTTISSIDAKLEYIVEIMVRMAEYEEKSIKEFRSDLGEIKESSKRLDQKLDRVEAIIENNAIESREESRLFNEKMDHLSEQVILVNETSKRQEHHIDRLVGIVETLVKVEAVAKNAG